VPDSSTDNLSKAGLEFGLGLIDWF